MRRNVNKRWRVSHVVRDTRNKVTLWNQGLSVMISTRMIKTTLRGIRSRFHNKRCIAGDKIARLANRLDGSRHFYGLTVKLTISGAVQGYCLDHLVALACRHFTHERWSTPRLHRITALLLSVVRKALYLEIDRAFRSGTEPKPTIKCFLHYCPIRGRAN